MNVLCFGTSFSSGSALGASPLIFLHGFPALRSKQNKEIAERVSQILRQPADVLLYDGLSQAPGVFRFSKALNDVLDYGEQMAARNGDRGIALVGHSFGGFMALHLASRLKERVRKLVLLSPLIDFGKPELVLEGLARYPKEYPELCLAEPAELAADFSQLGKAHPASQSAANLSKQTEVLILQAAHDQTTPAVHSEALLKFFAKRPCYEMVDNDHSFLSRRPELAVQIATFLAGEKETNTVAGEKEMNTVAGEKETNTVAGDKNAN